MSLYSYARAVANRNSSESRPYRTQRTPPPGDDHYLSDYHLRIANEVKQKLSRREYRPSPRICPQCRKGFADIEIDQIPLQYCCRCRGWWFDPDELKHFTSLFEDVADGDFADRETELMCPVCHQHLHEQPMRVTSNLLVHTCPEGHGIFLEDGEFTRAMEESDRVDGLTGHLNDNHLRIWRELQRKLAVGDVDESEVTCRECGERTFLVALDGVMVDFCVQCQSCWFDAQELQHFTGQDRDVPGDHLASRETSHPCPKCSRQLRMYQFHSTTNLLVEACPAGHGVYLNGGQFPMVMQASEHLP